MGLLVQFVCFGGSPSRMKSFAFYMVKELKYKLLAGQTLEDISKGSDRYVLYKVGPVLSVSVSVEMNYKKEKLVLYLSSSRDFDWYKGWILSILASQKIDYRNGIRRNSSD